MRANGEVSVDDLCEIVFAHLSQRLGEIVDDEPVVVREQLAQLGQWVRHLRVRPWDRQCRSLCWSLRHWRHANLQTLVDQGRGRVTADPSELAMRQRANCSSRRIDMVVMPNKTGPGWLTARFTALLGFSASRPG